MKPEDKLAPQGLKFAFTGNDATDWTVYADTLMPFGEKKEVQASPNTQEKSVTEKIKK
ncbi:hypothetical protein KIJ05_03345 [Leuconostoc gelidum subsp. gasicomitatum]|nr:hypothetical protein [Leuconostoc gasicomitatum]MBZ5984170.1 hypothetical protein [Leuconostoc gasicomitatum]